LLLPPEDKRIGTVVELAHWWLSRQALTEAERKELVEIVTRAERAESKESTDREERRIVASYLLADLHRHLLALPILTAGGGGNG